MHTYWQSLAPRELQTNEHTVTVHHQGTLLEVDQALLRHAHVHVVILGPAPPVETQRVALGSSWTTCDAGSLGVARAPSPAAPQEAVLACVEQRSCKHEAGRGGREGLCLSRRWRPELTSRYSSPGGPNGFEGPGLGAPPPCRAAPTWTGESWGRRCVHHRQGGRVWGSAAREGGHPGAHL